MMMMMIIAVIMKMRTIIAVIMKMRMIICVLDSLNSGILTGQSQMSPIFCCENGTIEIA